MRNLMNLQTILIRIAATLFVMLSTQFVVSSAVDALLPGTTTQLVANGLYAGLAILLLLSIAIAVPGYLGLLWKEQSEHRIHEVPIAGDRRVYVEFPADRAVNLLELGKAEIQGVTIGDANRVRTIARNGRRSLPSNIPFPIPEHTPDLLRFYLHETGENGHDER